MSEQRWTAEEMAEAFRRLVPMGPDAHVIRDELVILDVVARDSDILVSFRWHRYPWTLARGFGTEDEYDEDPENVDRWALDAWTYLIEQVQTGLVVGQRVPSAGGTLELVDSDGWGDRRVYYSDVPPDSEIWESLPHFETSWFNTTRLLELRDSGGLISWDQVYVNNSHGAPYIGHAAVVRVSDTVASIDFCDLAPGVPVSVMVRLCALGAHGASWDGVTEVVTEIDAPELDLLGFREVEGRRVLSTDFLHVDEPALRALVAGSSDWVPPRPPPLPKGRIRFAG